MRAWGCPRRGPAGRVLRWYRHWRGAGGVLEVVDPPGSQALMTFISSRAPLISNTAILIQSLNPEKAKTFTFGGTLDAQGAGMVHVQLWSSSFTPTPIGRTVWDASERGAMAWTTGNLTHGGGLTAFPMGQNANIRSTRKISSPSVYWEITPVLVSAPHRPRVLQSSLQYLRNFAPGLRCQCPGLRIERSRHSQRRDPGYPPAIFGRKCRPGCCGYLESSGVVQCQWRKLER